MQKKYIVRLSDAERRKLLSRPAGPMIGNPADRFFTTNLHPISSEPPLRRLPLDLCHCSARTLVGGRLNRAE
jgi:hypothetical protein